MKLFDEFGNHVGDVEPTNGNVISDGLEFVLSMGLFVVCIGVLLILCSPLLPIFIPASLTVYSLKRLFNSHRMIEALLWLIISIFSLPMVGVGIYISAMLANRILM